MKKEDKFIVTDASDIMCIGGFGNLKGNLGLLKYSEEELSKMIIENNNNEDNIRLINSLIRSIRELQNNWNELKECIEKVKCYVKEIDVIDKGELLLLLCEPEINKIEKEMQEIERKDKNVRGSN